MYKRKSGRNSKPKSNFKNESDVKDKFKGKVKDNDPSWYLVNGQLAKDVASFSFNNALGDPISIVPGHVFDMSETLRSNFYRVPGIASVLVGPSIGASSTETSPINVAARNIYSFVRHANSGHANYDPADLMLYLLAVDSVQTFWSWMVRVYGTTQTFSQRNRYVGDALLRSMGVDPMDIRANISQLRAYINQFAIKASVLAVPNTMSYYLRHAWMYQNIYTDEDNPKAQLFLFNPAYLYQYGLDDAQVGCLKPILVSAGPTNNGSAFAAGLASRTLTGIMNIGNSLINAMLSQEDVGIMSGDVLKAYGSDKLYRFNQIAEDYAVVPAFSEEVLGQFHNLNLVGRYPCSRVTDGWKVDYMGALSITQSTDVGSGNLQFLPAFAAAMDTGYTQIIDSWKQEVTPEDSLVFSRLKTWCAPNGGQVTFDNTVFTTCHASTLVSSGSEIALDIVLVGLDQNGATTQTNVRTQLSAPIPDAVNQGVLNLTDKFNEFPLQRSFNKTGSLERVYGELSNYTVVDETQLSAMHNAALLSMFGVPYNW